jgi:acyl phosphate:glycerol-3-phosphate acyltransferase
MFNPELLTQILLTFLLAIAAFWLAACPFAVWIGKLLLSKDIRKYGDHNPGTYNVFRAGSIKWGILALLIEIAKGFPFVFLAYHYFELPVISVMIVALCAILGHAFSPILKFRGGKALAVTGGVILAISPLQIFIIILAFMLIFFLFIDQDSWTVMFSFICTGITMFILKGMNWELLLLALIFVILAIKHFDDLKSPPRVHFKLLKLLHFGKTANRH